MGNPHLLDSIAKGNGMIGAAEELLWPAERVPSKVGIIYPRSSFFWDEQDVELPRGIMDCVRHAFSILSRFPSNQHCITISDQSQHASRTGLLA